MKFVVQFRQRCTFPGIENSAIYTNTSLISALKTSVSTFFRLAIDLEKGKCYTYLVVRERYTFRGLRVFSYNG